MLKKIFSTAGITVLMTAMISFVGATTANAVAPTIVSTSTIPNGTVSPSVTITTSSGPFTTANTLNWTVNTGTTGLVFYSVGEIDGTTISIVFQGTATCSGTITIQAKPAAFSNQTENSNTLSFAVTGSTCASDSTLSTASTIKGVAITSLGTPGTTPSNVVARGSVTITAVQAADTSNSGAFVTSFLRNESNARLVYVSKNSSSQSVSATNSYVNAAINTGDYFVVYLKSQNGANASVYIINVTITAGGSSSAPAICSADLLESSSTIKGVTFSKGTRQATSTDFIGAGSSYKGSITLTSAQASGSGVTSIVATSGATATWLYVTREIGRRGWGNPDISTTADLAGVTVENRIFDIKISGSGCTDYYRILITVESSAPGLSADEIAANAAAAVAAQAAAAEAQTAAVLATAIAKAKVAIATQFSTSKPATLGQFLDAGYGVRNDNVAAKASAAILKLSAADRENTQKIIEIINREDFIDRVAMTDTRSTVKSTDLVARGLLPADSTKKYSVIQGLASYPNGSLDSMAKIETAIKEQIEKAEAPKRLLAEIKARIAARKR